MAPPDLVDTAAVGPAPVRDSDIVELIAVPAGARPVAPAQRSAHLLVRAVVALVAGIASILVGTMVLTNATAVPRVFCVFAGLACLHVALDTVGRFASGPTFDAGYWVAVGWVVLLVVLAAIADLLPLKPYDDVQSALLEPSLLRPDLFSAHPLGTDRQGFDMLGSVIYGARISLLVGIGAVTLGMVIGSAIGMAAGHYRGKVDAAVGLLADALLAFPPLILLLAMVSVLDPSTLNVTLALALLGIPTYIRLSRANTMVFAQRDFVLAAQALGAGGRRIITREILPNVVLPLLSFAFIVIGASIVAEAGLSFLGLGIQRPTPTWGNMINGGQVNFQREPHVVFVPGMFLFMTVFSFNRIGERARKAWDPRGARL